MRTQVMADQRMMHQAVARPFWPTSAVDRAALGVAGLLLASGVIHLAILTITGGTWDGPLSLRKPATFGLSFGLTLLTITWVSHAVALSERVRARLVAAFAAASVLETVLVSLQTWRGVPSHFNVETAFDAWVTRGLAGGGIALVGMIVLLTAASFRASPRVPSGQVGQVGQVGRGRKSGYISRVRKLGPVENPTSPLALLAPLAPLAPPAPLALLADRYWMTNARVVAISRGPVFHDPRARTAT